MLYLGIDQHARQITISLRDEGGDVVQARQVSTQPEKVHAFFQQLTRQRLHDVPAVVAERDGDLPCVLIDAEIKHRWFCATRSRSEGVIQEDEPDPSQCPGSSPPQSGHLGTDGCKARGNVQGRTEPHRKAGLGEGGTDERK